MMLSKSIVWRAVLAALLSAGLLSCGSQGEISGGPLDELKPKVIGTKPTEFRSIKSKSLKIVFNKPIDEGSAESHIRFYPKLSFSAYAVDKTVNISIKSDLQRGKNYYLFIEKGLKCYHDIAMERSQTFIFCNDYLASNEISGEFIFEKEEDKLDTVLLKVYDQDSVFIFEKEAFSPGYQLQYLSQGTYWVSGFIDKNNNARADRKSEPYWEKTFLVNKKYTVEPILMGYTDTIPPEIKQANPAYSRRISVQFDDDLTKLESFSLLAVADTLVSVSQDGDTVRTVRKEQKVAVALSNLEKGKLSLLCAPMQERKYRFVAKGLIDWKKNKTEADTLYFGGKAVDIATAVSLVSSQPAKNSGVLSLLPNLELVFDRLLLPSQVSVRLIEKEDKVKMAVKLVSSDGFKFVYAPSKKLENFTSYLLLVSATDTEGNQLPATEIEFITTEKKE